MFMAQELTILSFVHENVKKLWLSRSKGECENVI